MHKFVTTPVQIRIAQQRPSSLVYVKYASLLGPCCTRVSFGAGHELAHRRSSIVLMTVVAVLGGKQLWQFGLRSVERTSIPPSMPASAQRTHSRQFGKPRCDAGITCSSGCVQTAMVWDHTSHYHRVLLRAVPAQCKRALDVGCGTGAFARLLARRSESVDALDQSSDVIERARALSSATPNVRFVETDFMTHPFENEDYDFIAMLASLHHLPFVDAIERIKRLLRPGGLLGVIGLCRQESLYDHAQSAVAWPVSQALRIWRGRSHDPVPIREPKMTFSEVFDGASRLMPSTVVVNRLFWRYTLLWTKPD